MKLFGEWQRVRFHASNMERLAVFHLTEPALNAARIHPGTGSGWAVETGLGVNNGTLMIVSAHGSSTSMPLPVLRGYLKAGYHRMMA